MQDFDENPSSFHMGKKTVLTLANQMHLRYISLQNIINDTFNPTKVIKTKQTAIWVRRITIRVL